MSLKSGTCSACGESNVYTNNESNRRGERGQIVLSAFKWMYIDTYICSVCGKFEEYVNDKDFRDEKNREKLFQEWDKVPKNF